MRIFINPIQQPIFVLVDGKKVINMNLALRGLYLGTKKSNVSKDEMERMLLTVYGLQVRVVENSWHWTTATIDLLPCDPFSLSTPELCGGIVCRWVIPAERQHETQKMVVQVTTDPNRPIDAARYGVFESYDQITSSVVIWYHSEISETSGTFEGHFVLGGNDSTDGSDYSSRREAARFLEHPELKHLEIHYPSIVPKQAVATLIRLTTRAYVAWADPASILQSLAVGIDYAPSSGRIWKTFQNGTGVFYPDPLEAVNGGCIPGAPGVWRLTIPETFRSIIKDSFAIATVEGMKYIAVINCAAYINYTVFIINQVDAEGVCKEALTTYFKAVKEAWNTENTPVDTLARLFPRNGIIKVSGDCAKRTLSACEGMRFSDTEEQVAFVDTVPLWALSTLTTENPQYARESAYNAFRELFNSLDKMGMDMATGKWPPAIPSATATHTTEAADAPEATSSEEEDDRWF